MESLLRLAMLAGTGAGLAGLRRAGKRCAWFVAVALAIGLLGAAAAGCFGIAAWYAIAPKLGPAWASAIVGLAFALSAAVIWLACGHWYTDALGLRRPPPLDPAASGLPSIDLPQLLERNATSVLLAAFVVGMLMNRRR